MMPACGFEINGGKSTEAGASGRSLVVSTAAENVGGGGETACWERARAVTGADAISATVVSGGGNGAAISDTECGSRKLRAPAGDTRTRRATRTRRYGGGDHTAMPPWGGMAKERNSTSTAPLLQCSEIGKNLLEQLRRFLHTFFNTVLVSDQSLLAALAVLVRIKIFRSAVLPTTSSAWWTSGDEHTTHWKWCCSLNHSATSASSLAVKTPA